MSKKQAFQWDRMTMRHPAIVGWQIDNELNCEIGEFYSEADDRVFRVFLQKNMAAWTG